MANIGTDEVKRLAALAKIGLTGDEVTVMAAEIGAIMEFVEQLQSVDTDGVEPTDQVTGLVDVMRADEVKPSMSPDELLANAPEREANYLKVRRVL
jgi:aspartyl-tRNA(Asn)/glutamyl-tRNA(Gln) amidotransferase subunit C